MIQDHKPPRTKYCLENNGVVDFHDITLFGDYQLVSVKLFVLEKGDREVNSNRNLANVGNEQKSPLS